MDYMDLTNEEVDEAWAYLVENGVATEEELQLVTDINGYSMQTLDDVVGARTEWHSVEQLKEENGDGGDGEDEGKEQE
jgi:hypothetical protein